MASPKAVKLEAVMVLVPMTSPHIIAWEPKQRMMSSVVALVMDAHFFGDIPRYAILSHTWGENEVLFADIHDPLTPHPAHMAGFQKVAGSCMQELHDGFDYIWIDTCCIDKSSSAELSESINSMFQWYQHSAVCYAYLADVADDGSPTNPFSDFEMSRWFTRGWTLQELLAPYDVHFYNRDWQFIRSREGVLRVDSSGRSDLAERINRRTNIPTQTLRRFAVLTQSYLAQYSVAQRFSWAASRSTTPIEDQAYSLLGIFGVHMPLLYGEGTQSFIRLQQEIMKAYNDQSLLAWTTPIQHLKPLNSLLAPSIAAFSKSDVVIVPSKTQWPLSSTEADILVPSSKFMDLGLFLCPLRLIEPRRGPGEEQSLLYLGILTCVNKFDLMSHPAIVLQAINDKRNAFYRVDIFKLISVGPRHSKGQLRSEHGVRTMFVCK
ncbi:heterokaryon incompatibility protein-domain-containing protein [Podospora didyma]|uniref:Heterokaryon incompatibility protein-domain-containing protein n=1 Tax=Podospora didyma TaxID=330526 RepID=A0AAE0N5T0_9PEZI|nr:heterokaryon incompatibility protein-domain-containing protein [Podospora didyma]